MKYVLLFCFLFLGQNTPNVHKESAFQKGEWFQFRMSYSGWFKAGEATLKVNEKKLKGKSVYHVVGKGKTTGAINWFFKVRDRFESYFDKETGSPYRFIRKTDEGGYTKDVEIDFNHEKRTATVNNKKKKKINTFTTEEDVQDMISLYYHLRNSINVPSLKIGDEIQSNMFFDEENYGFKLKFLGRETVKIRLNGSKVKIKALKFRPYVMAGRVFKEEESLLLWVSDDRNKIPLKIHANLAVGSLRADLEAFKGLKYSLPIVIDN